MVDRFPSEILSAPLLRLDEQLEDDDEDDELEEDVEDEEDMRFKLSTAIFMVCVNRSASSLH